MSLFETFQPVGPSIVALTANGSVVKKDGLHCSPRFPATGFFVDGRFGEPTRLAWKNACCRCGTVYEMACFYKSILQPGQQDTIPLAGFA